MTDNAKARIRDASSLLNVLGGLSGIITCCSVLIVGGRYTRQIDVNTERITVIERGGSPSLIAHEKMDEERVHDVQRRMDKVEDTIVLLVDVKGRMGVMDERIDNLSKRTMLQQDQINLLMQMKPKAN